MRFGHALVQHGATSAADQIPQAVAEHAVLFEGHQCLAVLPAHTDIICPMYPPIEQLRKYAEWENPTKPYIMCALVQHGTASATDQVL